MKLLVAGSRSIKEFDLSPYIPDDVDEIISGGANGIDAIAEKYADDHRISKHIMLLVCTSNVFNIVKHLIFNINGMG